MSRFQYPDPPHTNGRHPSTWPTVTQLTDTRLLSVMNEYLAAELFLRLNPETKTEKDREVLNLICSELHTEAVTRGLIDPYLCLETP